MTQFRRVAPLIIAFAFAGCVPNNSGSTLLSCKALTDAPTKATPKIAGSVFTIVIENHSRGQLIGKPAAPFITWLASKYAVANGYHDSFVHPSEANYLWMASGQNFAVLDDNDPKNHHLDSTTHIADQIEHAGLTWKSYQEGMGEPCGVKSHGRYAAKHNPFVFFNDVNGWDGTAFHPEKRCDSHVVDYKELAVDIAHDRVPNYVFITPDLDHDMHDGTVREADDWLRREVTMIMNSDAYRKGGVIFLLGDEGGGLPAKDDPPFIVISNLAKPAFQSRVEYDTSSYLKTVETLLGLPPLPCAADRTAVPLMADLFKTPLTADPSVARN